MARASSAAVAGAWTLAGAALGLSAAWTGSRYIESMLFEAKARDLTSFAVVFGFLSPPGAPSESTRLRCLDIIVRQLLNLLPRKKSLIYFALGFRSI